MYVTEVAERVGTYFPSEYSREEMYAWCDEVSAMLAAEDRNIFMEAELSVNENGSFSLPKGVAFEDIAVVVSGGRVIPKEDLRQSILRKKKLGVSEITVVYLAPVSPIRAVSYKGDCEFSKVLGKIILGRNSFRKGDILQIEANGKSYSAAVDDVGVLGDRFTLSVTGNIDEDFSGKDIKIVRKVTEKTVCSAPYDTMYIDYCLAKIALYQHDFECYNQFMGAFNSRLGAYKRRMADLMPQAKRKFCNWW